MSLSGAHLDAQPEPLSDLSSIGTQVVETNHLLIEGLDADQLGVAGILGTMGQGPLQRPEACVVDLYIVFPVLLNGVLLRESAAAVLQGG
jgi:hypothetical protein